MRKGIEKTVEAKKENTFKRRNRSLKRSDEKLGVVLGNKRDGVPMETDGDIQKKQKGTHGCIKIIEKNAGLADQSCESQ
jgi:hypothetical protein